MANEHVSKDCVNALPTDPLVAYFNRAFGGAIGADANARAHIKTLAFSIRVPVGHHPAPLEIDDGVLDISLLVEDDLWVGEKPGQFVVGHFQVIQIDEPLFNLGTAIVFVDAELVLQARRKQPTFEKLNPEYLRSERGAARTQLVLGRGIEKHFDATCPGLCYIFVEAQYRQEAHVPVAESFLVNVIVAIVIQIGRERSVARAHPPLPCTVSKWQPDFRRGHVLGAVALGVESGELVVDAEIARKVDRVSAGRVLFLAFLFARPTLAPASWC